MKNVLRRAFLAAFFLLLGTAAARAADTYTLDSAHTNIDWRISHFGFSYPSGKFVGAQGTLILDQANPANSKVMVTIPIGGLVTGNPKLDEHLKSKEFFDADDFPTATFQSTSVRLTGKDTAKVTGNFTLHGVTKPLVLDVQLNKIGENMMHKQTAGFGATASLQRSDFGMNAFLPGLGDEVTLTIQTEANLNP